MTDAQCRTEEKVVCYLCTTSPCYKLLHRFYQSDPSWSWCMPACSWFCFASPFASLYINSSWPLSPHLDHLIIYILWTTARTPSSTVAPQLNWRQAPPSFLAALPQPSSLHCFLSSPVNSLWSGNTACFSDTNLSEAWSTWDNVLPIIRWTGHIMIMGQFYNCHFLWLKKQHDKKDTWHMLNGKKCYIPFPHHCILTIIIISFQYWVLWPLLAEGNL